MICGPQKGRGGPKHKEAQAEPKLDQGLAWYGVGTGAKAGRERR